MKNLTRIRLCPQRRSVGIEMDLKEYLNIQSREIERHKWIESEKAGRDLGMEAAIDWILKYADLFSDSYVQERKTS
ncbi:MAG TPA: hypothetical protein VK463_09185 [Desulfomonilaceae bacterium]|nr:hypothetical protein [Desulfomonilaceae bacterium]